MKIKIKYANERYSKPVKKAISVLLDNGWIETTQATIMISGLMRGSKAKKIRKSD